MGERGVRDDLLGERPGAVQVAQQGSSVRSRLGRGRYASIRAVAWVVWPGTVGLAAVKAPVDSSAAIRTSAPRKRTTPASDSASS